MMPFNIEAIVTGSFVDWIKTRARQLEDNVWEKALSSPNQHPLKVNR